MNKTSTWHLKVVSVIMAMLLWLFITNENVIIKQQDVAGVSLKCINLSPGLSASYPEEVSVSIVGTPRSAREISAYIDLKDKEPGVYTVPVRVEQMPGTRVSSVTPAEVRVEITESGEYIFPVSYRVREEPPAGYRVAGIDVTPEKCVVRGDLEKINRVDSLVIHLDLGSLRDTAALATQVTALDGFGKPVTGVEIMPGEVQAYVVIEKVSSYTVVAVSPSLTGNPPEGFVVGETATVPSKVTLIGSEQDLAGIESVKTKPVDISGRNQSFRQEVELAAIPGIEIFPQQVTVMVDISAAEQQEEPVQ
ncbi:MAG: YbbR-like domain-containing protein [Syntrophomonadales bacterium]|jgi:YbbR domain-containing protein